MKTMELTRKIIRQISVTLRIAPVLIFLAQSLLLAAPSYCESINEASSRIRTPEELAAWLTSNFEYQWSVPATPQTLQEMLSRKSGTCEDFANLVSSILTRKGIENKIVVIKFKDLSIYHAVCIWKTEKGTYNFISNKTLRRTNATTIEGAIASYYDDYEKIMTVADARPSI